MRDAFLITNIDNDIGRSNDKIVTFPQKGTVIRIRKGTTENFGTPKDETGLGEFIVHRGHRKLKK